MMALLPENLSALKTDTTAVASNFNSVTMQFTTDCTKDQMQGIYNENIRTITNSFRPFLLHSSNLLTAAHETGYACVLP